MFLLAVALLLIELLCLYQSGWEDSEVKPDECDTNTKTQHAA